MGRISVFFTTEPFDNSRKVWGSFGIGWDGGFAPVRSRLDLGGARAGSNWVEVGGQSGLGTTPSRHSPKALRYLPPPKPPQSRAPPAPSPQAGLQRRVNPVGMSLDAH